MYNGEVLFIFLLNYQDITKQLHLLVYYLICLQYFIVSCENLTYYSI